MRFYVTRCLPSGEVVVPIADKFQEDCETVNLATSHPVQIDFARWKPLLELSAQEVFSIVLGDPLEINCRPFPDEPLDVTSMVGLAGNVSGVVRVRCSRRATNLIAGRMLSDEAAQSRANAWDALGELCNMIAGNFKNKVVELADGCMISVPTVIAGADYYLHPLGENQRAETQFSFRGMPVTVAIEVNL